MMEKKPITEALLAQWTEAYEQDPARRVAELALSRSDLNDVAFCAKGAMSMQQKFSLELETLPVTNQKASGRCWLFAATNVLRERIAKEKNMEQFELSQSWLAFWDKFERANYFLELMMELADRPADDREVMFLLQTGVHDGGQWDMFANIVRKYGVVPKDVFGETAQTGSTRAMNAILNRALKAAAIRLRGMIAAGTAEETVQAAKNEVLGKIYGFLCSCYGVPPKNFDFEYVDKDHVYHVEKSMTPAAFTEKYVGDLLDRTVSVVHSPTKDKPYHETFTVRYLNNVAGGKPVKHLNLTMDEMKQAIIRQMEAGKPVWFGSDVGKYGDRSLGLWDDGSFDYEALTGLDLTISKEDGLDYSFSAMNHAMVLTGVHLVDGKPVRWKIENSWGDDKGSKGYYVCSDSWFDLYVYQAAIEREYLGDLAAFAESEPKEMDPWDPMGTLAR